MKRILILVGSARHEGNTLKLAEAFAEGAQQSTDIVTISDLNIHPCHACDYCFASAGNQCAQHDDMNLIYEKMKHTDVLVLASPIYFFGISAQLKCLIDRLHNPIRQQFPIKQLGLLLVAGSSRPYMFETTKKQFEIALNHFGKESIGIITVSGVRAPGDIDNQPDALNAARAMGAALQES